MFFRVYVIKGTGGETNQHHAHKLNMDTPALLLYTLIGYMTLDSCCWFLIFLLVCCCLTEINHAPCFNNIS